IYQRNALEAYRTGVSSFHTPWRGDGFDDLVTDASTDPLFSMITRASALPSMHLTSAAFRLPVALLKTLEALPGKASAFDPFCTNVQTDLDAKPLPAPVPVEWPRARLETIRIHAPTACCDLRPTGGSTATSELIALAMTVALRDDFAHGETGLS